MIRMPEIDEQKCNVCGLCLDVCKCDALTLSENVVKVTETEDCHWCTLCEAVCPTGALTCAFEIVLEKP
jgi:MinD superfamily P-loop ATPase